MHFDIRIDDKLNNLVCDSSLNLLYDSYQNGAFTKEELTIKGVIRVYHWKGIERIFLEQEN